MLATPFSAHLRTSRTDCPIWAGRFHSPSELITARTLDQVCPLIQSAESAAQRGQWVVLFLDYAAAPAFDSALKVFPPLKNGLPLACAACFDKRILTPNRPKKGSAKVRGGSNANHEALRMQSWRPLVSPETYERAVAKIRKYIRAGDVYQVNFTFPFSGRFSGDPSDCFCVLSQRQPEAYQAHIKFGPFHILSFSPELFFARRGRKITVRPMKGTAPRGRWFDEDRAMAEDLTASPKEQAENLMIVDLLRNDLGRIAEPGSVRVRKLFSLERHPTLWQMTSTIEARTRKATGLTDCFDALFPCGSVTGAPKIRAAEIIAELESRPRGLYTGAVGLISPGGDCLFTVAIRTLILDTQTRRATYGVGSGITFDSSPKREFAECRLKSAIIELSAPAAIGADTELLETLRLAQGKFALLPEHLRRLRESAEYFGYSMSPAKIRRALEKNRARYPRGFWRVRLTLDRRGDIETKVQPIPAPTARPWRLGRAPFAVDSANPMLYHKTTQRELYERALRDRPECDDVLLWNQRGEFTESTIANLVVELDGQLLTPPLECGLLPGTLRARLLHQGRIRERVIAFRDLRRARRLFLINSLRGWIPAQLAFEP